MGNLKKGRKIIWMLALIFIIGMAPNVSASSILEYVQAYRGVRIFYNGQELTDEKQPYVINDTTYVPLRMLMENIGCNVYWDAVNYRVVVTDNSAARDSEIAALKSEIAQLQAVNSQLEDHGDSLGNIEEAVSNIFEDDAGDVYFDDDGIEVTINLSGDEYDIFYTISLDFADADDYDDLKDVDEGDLEDFLSDIEDKIEDEANGTNFADARLTGMLKNAGYSKYYIDCKNGEYDFSWDNRDDLDSIEEAVSDTFEEAGEDYFDDTYINISIKLRSDDDDIAYILKLCFDDATKYDDLKDLDQDDIEDFLEAVTEEIYDEADDTDYEDPDITGILRDLDNSGLYVEDDEGDYNYSWDNGDISDIEDAVSDVFKDVDDYFDDNIECTITVSGDEDHLVYRVKLDFDDANDYSDLSDLDQDQIEQFLLDLEDKIYDEMDDTDYEDADLTGKLSDDDNSSLYVEYDEDGDHNYSW